MNLIEEVSQFNWLKIICSNPFSKSEKYSKITLRFVESGGESIVQVEKFTRTQAFHENLTRDEVQDWLESNILNVYKQVCVLFGEKTVTYLYSKSSQKRLENKVCNKVERTAFNRPKKYLLNEGDNISAFVDLGIFTKDGKIVQAKYDKFKQINRFLEIIDDIFRNFEGDELTVLDFGCGKSYLTFFVYYYFVVLKKIKAKIIGYDLKADVVENCNAIAAKYGYSNLHFVVADVSKDKLYDEKIDMVLSLHACDTATDYALHYAIRKGVKYIFSVPCCQHEVNSGIGVGGDLDVLLKYGIIKERVSALLTDTVRAMLLEDCGYSVDVMEFVDLTHSPKNLMLRAKLSHKKSHKNKAQIEVLMQKYGFSQTLYNLLEEEAL